MKRGLIPTMQQGWFGQTIQKNVPFQNSLQKVNKLFYAMLEAPKILPQIISSFEEKSFLNHMLTVFEDWFENTLLKNLREDRKVLIAMYATYHSGLSEKGPTMNMKKWI